jgi:hypothetical protein
MFAAWYFFEENFVLDLKFVTSLRAEFHKSYIGYRLQRSCMMADLFIPGSGL